MAEDEKLNWCFLRDLHPDVCLTFLCPFFCLWLRAWPGGSAVSVLGWIMACNLHMDLPESGCGIVRVCSGDMVTQQIGGLKQRTEACTATCQVFDQQRETCCRGLLMHSLRSSRDVRLRAASTTCRRQATSDMRATVLKGKPGAGELGQDLPMCNQTCTLAVRASWPAALQKCSSLGISRAADRPGQVRWPGRCGTKSPKARMSSQCDTPCSQQPWRGLPDLGPALQGCPSGGMAGAAGRPGL